MHRLSIISQNSRTLRHQHQQQREFVPFLLSAAVGALIGSYCERAFRASTEGASVTKSTDNGPARSFGIDLGSSFSRIAIKEANGVSPFVIENREGKRLTSSVVYFPHGINVADQSYNGTDDDSFIVGTTANKSRYIDPEKTICASSLLAKSLSTPAKSLGEVQKSFFYFLLAKDLKIAASSRSEDEASLPTFVSVPNHFTSAQSSLLLSACKDAGFNCVASLPDGVSAVLGAIATALYAPPTVHHDTVVVVDVGGGLVQLSLVLVKSVPTSIPIILSQRTLLDSGGNFFDDAIVDHLILEFNKSNSGIDISADKRARQRLYDAAEAAKVELSTAYSSNVIIPFLTADHTGPKHLECVISRSQLSTILDDHLKNINDAIFEIIDDGKNQFKGTDISSHTTSSDASTENNKQDLKFNLAAVILVGGGARMSLVRSSIQNVIGSVPLLVSQQPEEIVSIGAAVLTVSRK